MIADMNPALHAAAHLVTLRVLQSLVEGFLVAIFAAGVLGQRRFNARTRFAVWFASLIAMATVPLIAGEWQWVTNAAAGPAAITLPDSYALYLLGIWAVIAGWLLLGVLRSLVHLRRIRNSCSEIDVAKLDSAIRDNLRRNQGTRPVVLCTSTEVRVPTALGLMRPAVVIPDSLVQELSSEELNQILLHELAHLRRWDDWTNLAQQLIKAIFFFHPAVWWIEKKIALEREMACDDAVIAETRSPRLYAECLARLAEKNFVHRSAVLAQAALGKIRQTTLRVARILDPQRSSTTNRSLVPAVSVVAVFAIGCGVWSARTSRLIAFEDGTPAQTISATTDHESVGSVRNFVAADSVPAIGRSSHLPRVMPAKLTVENATHRRGKTAKGLPRSGRPARAPDHLVRSASLKVAAVPVTETIFVVIENQDPNRVGSSGYRIQMWRFTVFQTLVDPNDSQILPKQI